MSVRGPRGRGRGRGSGRGRGRGRGGKTIVWEWESYRPGPEVYDQLWHIRKEPATVTPFLPTESPIQNARSRILDRRQTEGDIQRNFYVVEVTHLQAQDSSILSDADEVTQGIETYHVDLSRILEFVSPEELERFENEQFRLEAEAEEVARRAEAEEVARRRLRKNASAPGAGKGSLYALGSDAETRSRGRPRGRGRGRGRGSWRGRDALTMNSRPLDDDMLGELVEAEPVETFLRAESMLQEVSVETESEDEPETNGRTQTSPGIARSAFVANSALPVSPMAHSQRLRDTSLADRESTEEDVLDIDLIDEDPRYMASAAMRLRIKDDFRGRSNEILDDLSDELGLPDRHRSKRRRTESTASIYPTTQKWAVERSELNSTYPWTPFAHPLKDTISEPATKPEESTPAQQSTAAHHSPQSRHRSEVVLDNVYVQPRSQIPTAHRSCDDEDGESGGKDEPHAEEYVVEAIVEHYREAGKTYYLVKWQGYEDSHDWLPEEDLEGAAELVAEYNQIIRRRKKLHMTKK